MSAIHLDTEKWLRLCRQAEQASLLAVPNIAADHLAGAAGRLTMVTEPLHGAILKAMGISFRWDCTAFGMAAPEDRALLAEGLKAKAVILRRMLQPVDPSPVAAAMPVPEIEQQPAWTRRADIGGGFAGS